jgi:hypothetical protein
MRKIVQFLILIILVSTNISYAQKLCSFDERMAQLIANNPAQAQLFKENEERIQQFIKSHEGQRNPNSTQLLYNIPVVVHVMHTGGAVGTLYNPIDANIIGAINYMNQVFGGTYAGMEAPVEGGPVVNLEIQFALAQRTPSCGSTNGINRVNASSIPNYTSFGVNANNSNGCSDVDLKNFSRWDPAQYYNIWLVNKIDGADGTSGQFIAGYAYFPGSPANIDGTVMLATQMLAGEKTLPHELGHAFNLHHPFNGSNLNTQCPTNTNCNTQGDLVCDTDPISNNVNGSGVYDFSCRTGTNSCTGTAFTRNTEKNFMSYTNCYTLFTNGQKARVQAAMSLPSRSSLGTSLGATPCGTVVNFETATATQAESTTGTTTGCRTYNDYTYRMTIGAAPTQNAVVTLTFGGSATKTLDYEVTTNGNFTTPSNTLTFASGSTATQSFTLRVFNDANVEASENIVLGFTLNNNGGNATIGTTTATSTITLNDNDLAPVATASSTSTIGGLTIGITDAPFNTAIASQRVQTIYKASELTAAGLTAGNLNAVQLFVNTKSTSGSFNNFTIKMAQTSSLYLYDNGTTNLAGALTTVFTTASYTTNSGWNVFALSTPFAWNGVSNLVIEYCYNSVSAGASGADQLGCYSDGGGASQGAFAFQDGINCSTGFSAFSYYGTGVKPQLRLGLAVTGTPVETAAAATKSEHIDAGSDDYFYSAGGNLMTRIRNVSQNLGCVSTTLSNSGSTWVSFSGTSQRSAKAFTITPTTNGGTVTYTISLYLTNAELGGKAPSSIIIAKSSAASVGSATTANTVYGTTSHSTLGTNHVFTANFTGLSTFFMIDNTILPITLLNFNATLDQKVAKLNWTTLQETNNLGFDIEKSSDGINFTKLGFVNGRVNSSIATTYNYIDNNLTNVQYYRLKQINTNGSFTYSEVKKVVYNNKNAIIESVNNPFENIINIKLYNKINEKVQINLFDAKGAIVYNYSGFVSNNIITLNDFSELSEGIYFIKLSVSNISETKKLIKK